MSQRPEWTRRLHMQTTAAPSNPTPPATEPAPSRGPWRGHFPTWLVSFEGPWLHPEPSVPDEPSEPPSLAPRSTGR